MRCNLYQNKLVKIFRLDNHKIIIKLISNKIDEDQLNDYHNVLLRIFENIYDDIHIIYDIKKFGFPLIKFMKRGTNFIKDNKSKFHHIKSYSIILTNRFFVKALNFFIRSKKNKTPFKFVSCLNEAKEFISTIITL